MNIIIDSNIQNIIMRLGGVDYPISALKLSENGNEAVTVWGGSEPTIDYSKEYFTITSWQDSNTISIKHGNVSFTLYISYDKETWSTLSTSSSTQTIQLNCGESAYFKAVTSQLCGSDGTSAATTFTASKYFEASGNIMSLIWGDNFEDKTILSDMQYIFYGLFYGASTLLTLENLILPQTTYYNWIFQHFANNCSALIKAPKELPQETYNGRNTFVWMFANCPKLQETPIIRLTQNASGDGWHQMFNNDSSLKRVICLLDGSNIYVNGSAWLSNVSGTGVFYKKSTSSWRTGSTAIPSGWTVRDWSEDASNYIKVTSTPDYKYSCFVEGTSDYYKAGDSVTLACTPINGYSFNGWYVNGTLISSNSTYTFTASQNIEVTPVLNEPQWAYITVNVNDSTKGSATGSGRYGVGYTATITATPSGNPYYFVGWYSNGIIVSSTSTYAFVVSGDMTLEARFADKAQYTITATANDASYGTATGGGIYYSGDSVTVTATPSGNAYYFDGWYSNGTIVSRNSNYTFTVSGNKTLEARFAAKAQYTVTVAINDASYGTATGGGTYYDGDSVTVTATPNSGYIFDGWFVNGAKVSGMSNYTFTISSNTTITATFSEASTAYTQVSYIKTTSTSGTTNYYFDTGISTGPKSGTIELDMQFMPLANNGDVFYGHMGSGYSSPNDSRDFRIFWYGGNVYCDVGDGRKSTSTNAGFNSLKEWIWTINYANGNYNVKLSSDLSAFMSGTYSYSPNIYNIFINLSPQKFKALTIKKDDITVFDGVAALDTNNVPCIYDKISGTFKYNSGSGAASGLTYEA